MKAITTRHLGPVNYIGSRIKAFDMDGNNITIPKAYGLSSEKCHRKAAETLCGKMEWNGDMVCGAIKDGYVFVFSG